MKEINIGELLVGNIVSYSADGKAVSGFNGTEQSIKIIAEKVNEIIRHLYVDNPTKEDECPHELYNVIELAGCTKTMGKCIKCGFTTEIKNLQHIVDNANNNDVV